MTRAYCEIFEATDTFTRAKSIMQYSYDRSHELEDAAP